MWEISHSKPNSFYDEFTRKDGELETTHYCPGCGHGVLHKLIAEAISEFGIQDRTVLVSPVGCSVFAYHYLDVGNVQASHGRAPAVATGIKRVLPNSIVLAYQGDGDLAAIGGNEILHAANRGEHITVFFVNNAIYGMTGGQMAPTTPLGERTTTSPRGRHAGREGFPLKMCELLATLEAPVYIERVALTDPKQIMRARKAVRRAIKNQVERRGFSFVEVLSACPTGWHLPPKDAVTWIEQHLIPVFPLKVFKNAAVENQSGLDAGEAEPIAPVSVEEFFRSFPESVASERRGAVARGATEEATIKISGFGGQGILFLGIALAEAGLREGLNVSWIPSYGPEIRGGTAHCHVRLDRAEIASPLISRPSVVMVFNEPSLDKFESEIRPGGLLLINSSMVKRLPKRKDIRVLWVPATDAAKDLGNPKVANMVLLGTYIEETGAVEPESVLASLAGHGLNQELLRLNRAALTVGRGLAMTV